jgi:asparagine synthase (glutamine-hydrolysing)
MYVPAPLTMFKNIYKLPQAHWLRLNGRGMKVEKYWDLKDFKEIESEQEIIEKIQELMRRSVKGQLISDRPVGTFLSGGIDSTSVLGIAREFKKDKIKTFSVGFDVDDQNDKFNADLSLARKTSEFYDTEHHELIINSRDILNNLEKVVYHMDEPVAEATQIATFLLSELAKKEVAVVLGGDGGDELFGGYKRYYYSYWLDRYKLIRLFPSLKTKIYFKFMSQKEDEIASVLNSKINNGKITETFFRENYFKSRADFVNQYMLADLKTWLADESLMRSDKMTMAHGLEERVPILDHQLVELSVKIPCKYKMLNKDQGKLIFIKAMKKYLPEHVLNSRGKKVWMTPVSQWLRTDLNLKAREILSLDYFSGSAEYLDFGGISRMFEDHIKKRKYNLNLIWALINFQIWCKNYLR